MKLKRSVAFLAGAVLICCAASSWADDYTDTIQLFKEAGASRSF